MLDPTTQALEDQIAGRQQLRAEIKRLRALVEGACAALDDTGNELARARATEILRAAGVDLSKRACDPVGACESHGRCWTHSEWGAKGQVMKAPWPAEPAVPQDQHDQGLPCAFCTARVPGVDLAPEDRRHAIVHGVIVCRRCLPIIETILSAAFRRSDP